MKALIIGILENPFKNNWSQIFYTSTFLLTNQEGWEMQFSIIPYISWLDGDNGLLPLH